MTVDIARQALSMFKADDVAARPRHPGHDDDFARHVRLDHSQSEGMKTAQALGSAVDGRPAAGAKATFGLEQTVAERLRQTPVVLQDGAQSRLYPEGLVVIGYLSMLGVAHNDTNRGDPDGHDVRAPASRMREVTGNVSVTDMATGSLTGTSAPGVVNSPMVVTFGEDTRASSEVARQVASIGLPACPWPRQLMRMTSNDKTNTLWIRDYRISPEDACSSASTIADRLGVYGKSVDRVVLNGHVVMRRPGGDATNQRSDNHVG